MNMITIFIENKAYKVREDQNLLQACLSLGFNIPYFCWHPAMHSVGACRQCAVKEYKDEQDTRGRIVMSCMTGVKEGMRISIEDPEAKSFRKSIIELLMLNHPHDCPVCDEGGECHLQDMTLMAGHVYRRTRFKKRSYANQNLGPFITHEMNRCIQCYRCVRYYRDYAGGRDFDAFAIHDAVYFGRQQDGVLQNEFSGNLVEVCPTGVFTDKTFQKHYTRKWDLQTAPSICVHCGVGCNTIPGERYGELRRIRCRYHGQVNRYFLCDRGRFGYEFVNSGKRIRQPLIRGAVIGAEQPVPASRNEALSRIKTILTESKGLIGIGSPRASLESNFALRTLVGPEHFYSGMSRKEQNLVELVISILRNGPARSPSLREVESCDAVLVLGEDVTNTAPLLALSLRQSARQKAKETAAKMRIPLWDDGAVRNAAQGVNGVFFTAAPYRTKLDGISRETFHASPDDIARFGFAVAHELKNDLPAPDLDSEARRLAGEVARELRNAKKPLIVSGIGCGSEAVIRAAANIAWSLSSKDRVTYLCFALPECNSMGVGLMSPQHLDAAFTAVRDGRADTAIVLENDLYRRAGRSVVDNFLGGLKHLIVLDQIETGTTVKAEITLSAATFAEADGTLVNSEGRAQRFYQVFVPEGDTQESWRWLRDMMTAAAFTGGRNWESVDDVISSLAVTMPVFGAVPDIAPPAGFRIAGMKIPRQPHRYSGRTAMYANKTVSEPKPPRDRDSPLAFSMEGFPGQPPSPLIPRFWAPEWNSPQAMNKFQEEVGGSLKGGDPGVRLIDPAETEKTVFFKIMPASVRTPRHTVLVVPSYHIFGSEELSSLSPGIAELMPRPYLGISTALMKDLKLAEGDVITLDIDQAQASVAIKPMPGLRPDVAALPAGLSGMEHLALPAFGTVVKAGKTPEVRG